MVIEISRQEYIFIKIYRLHIHLPSVKYYNQQQVYCSMQRHVSIQYEHTGVIPFIILIVKNFEKKEDRIHLKLVMQNVLTNEIIVITRFSFISHQCLPYDLIKLHNFSLHP